MSTQALLTELRNLGVEVAVEGENLAVYAPPAIITPELVAEIKEHKASIIKVLREDEEMEQTGVIQSERQVFELAREYFGLDRGEVHS